MDPVINCLSFGSPCRPSLGKALLINPEKQTRTITLLIQNKQTRTHCGHTQAPSTLKWSSFPARVSPAHGSLHHVVSALQLVGGSGAVGVFPRVLDSFWTNKKNTMNCVCLVEKYQLELLSASLIKALTIIREYVTTLAFIDDMTFR